MDIFNGIKFFNLIKEINRLRKKKNRLLSKRIPNIYLKVIIVKNQKLTFAKL